MHTLYTHSLTDLSLLVCVCLGMFFVVFWCVCDLCVWCWQFPHRTPPRPLVPCRLQPHNGTIATHPAGFKAVGVRTGNLRSLDIENRSSSNNSNRILNWQIEVRQRNNEYAYTIFAFAQYCFFSQSRLELYMHAFMGATASQNNSEVAA